jgi:hypothetical protein
MGTGDRSKFGTRGNGVNPRGDKFGWADGSGSGAVRVRLSKEQREACDGDFEHVGLDMAELFEAVQYGFKFSLSFSPRNSVYFATLTDKREGSETEGQWVTLSAGDPGQAAFRILWVVGTLVDGDLVELKQRSEKQGYDW